MWFCFAYKYIYFLYIFTFSIFIGFFLIRFVLAPLKMVTWSHDAVEMLLSLLLLFYNSRYFDNYLEGELVMFRHRTLPYEVRTFQRRCNGHAACHCAIAIRSGDDVILIDSCGPDATPETRTPQIEVRLYLNGDLTPGTEIIQYDGGRTYKVSI